MTAKSWTNDCTQYALSHSLTLRERQLNYLIIMRRFFWYISSERNIIEKAVVVTLLNLNTRDSRSWSDFNAKRSWWITLNNFLLFSYTFVCQASQKEFLFPLSAKEQEWEIKELIIIVVLTFIFFFFENIKRSFNDILRWGSMKELEKIIMELWWLWEFFRLDYIRKFK